MNVSPPERIEEMRRRLAMVPEPVALLEGIFAHSPLALQIYNAAGQSLLTNPAFRELFGSEPPPEYNVLNDEIAEAKGVLGLIRRAFQGETVHVPPVWYDPRELKQVRMSEGKRVAMESTFFPLFDREGKVSHVAIAFKDVTAEHQARAQADEQLRILQAVVSQSGDGIVVCDEQGVVRVFNEAAERQHGIAMKAVGPEQWPTAYGLKTLDGRPMPPEQTPLFRALQGDRVEDAVWQVERPDGSRRVLGGTAVPMRAADGRIAGAVLITRDETERRTLEEERHRLLEQLQRSVTFREQVLGIVGHDLRNPLSVISASAAVLASTPLDERQRRNVERIASNTDRMARMIRDLLDYTRTRLGDGLPVNRREVDLEPLLRRLVEETQVTHAGRTVRLWVSGPVKAFVDPDRVIQAVANLLSNALAHGDPLAPVGLSARADTSGARIEVSNRGEPIATDLLPHLFEPFAARSTHRTRNQGLGLGLSIVKAISDAHGGRVSATSSREAGTTFTLFLPNA